MNEYVDLSASASDKEKRRGEGAPKSNVAQQQGQHDITPYCSESTVHRSAFVHQGISSNLVELPMALAQNPMLYLPCLCVRACVRACLLGCVLQVSTASHILLSRSFLFFFFFFGP